MNLYSASFFVYSQKVLAACARCQQESCAIAKMTARCALSVSDHPLRRYVHSKLSKMAAGQDVTRNSAIRSADPENHILEPNMKCVGSSVAGIWIRVSWGI